MVDSPLIRFDDWVAKATLKLFGVEMTGAWIETEEEVLETRAQLRNRLGTMMEESNCPKNDAKRTAVKYRRSKNRFYIYSMLIGF